MLGYLWPIGLVVLSNTIYHICSKQMPEGIDPMASLTVTYAVGAVVSFILYFAFNGKGADLLKEYKSLNFAPVLLGVVIVGLEAGFIYAYKAGWQVSTAQTVSSVVLSAALIVVGALLFGEKITWNKVAGIVVCLGGLWLINMK